MGVESEGLASPDSLETQDDLVTDVQDDDQASSDSSSEDGTDENFDLLSVVRDAVAEREDDNSASSTEPEEDGSQPEGEQTEADGDDDAGPDQENFSDVPFHTHPRFKELIDQRNRFKEGAQQFEQVQTFLSENGLSSDEAADALRLRALMKSDPAQAWDQLKPVVQQLLRDVGAVLPADLQEQVRNGQITKEAAAEISRLRAAEANTTRQNEARDQRAQQDAEVQRQRNVQSAVGDWETQQRARDPDFEAKLPDLQREIIYLQRTEGQPSDPASARKQIQKAYDSVTKRLAPKPAPRPAKQPLPQGRSTGDNKPAQEPKTMLDIVRAGRQS